jgi:cytochrome o ubiquinol oxidase subunit 2
MKRKKTRLRALVALIIVALFVIGLYLSKTDLAVLNPQGAIAQKEYNLIVFGTVLSLAIIVPVFVMTFLIVRKYRVDSEGNYTKKKGRRQYTPDWDHDRKLETIWWGVPLVLIIILAGVTWQSSHELDPSKPISESISAVAPIKVQVVALQWKWLFIYPEQGVASVNYLQFPANTPVDFQITADAPMNSFWIPKLGGQIYAMSGMSTQLHLIANKTGEYRGVSANLSGDGFAGMDFLVRSVPNNEFANWVQTIKNSAPSLDQVSYEQLAKPSKENQPAFYNFGNDPSSTSIYDTVVEKYMMPTENTDTTNTMQNMDMMPHSTTRMQLQHGQNK